MIYICLKEKNVERNAKEPLGFFWRLLLRKKSGEVMSAKIKFTDMETKEEIEFDVIEETRINNTNYLLVTESDAATEDEEETAYIIKDISEEMETEARYIIVEDDNEVEYVSKIFEELLEDVELN